MLELTPDQLLSTTRAVRRRLDLGRPVARELIEQCLELAVQAPTSTNMQHWHFVVVTDAETRRGLAGIYRDVWMTYADGAAPEQDVPGEPPGQASSRYLAAHLHEVPLHRIPCVEGAP